MPILQNPKWEVFAQHLARGKTQLEAYKSAGYAPNDSDACSLANRPEVKTRVTEFLGLLAERAQVTTERVLTELARIGFSDVTDVVEIKRGKVKVRDTAELPAHVRSAVSEIRNGRDGVTVKLHDKARALEQLGKHLGMFKENIQIDVNVSLLDLVNQSYKLDRGELIDVTPAAPAPADASHALPSDVAQAPDANDDKGLAD